VPRRLVLWMSPRVFVGGGKFPTCRVRSKTASWKLAATCRNPPHDGVAKEARILRGRTIFEKQRQADSRKCWHGIELRHGNTERAMLGIAFAPLRKISELRANLSGSCVVRVGNVAQVHPQGTSLSLDSAELPVRKWKTAETNHLYRSGIRENSGNSGRILTNSATNQSGITPSFVRRRLPWPSRTCKPSQCASPNLASA
jgi:hypothetical protein